MNFLAADLRFALRRLRRSPGFAATALLTLAFAIGATAAMVSVLRATLLNPTPFQSASRLVSLKDENEKGFEANGLMTVARALDLAHFSPGRHGRLFQQLAYFYFDEPALGIGAQAPVSISAAVASGDFFSALGTRPVLGRTFSAADDKPGASEVVVISYGLWKQRFAGNPGIVGTAVRLGGTPATVIGVMPRQFNYPVSTDAWKPAHLSATSFGGYRGSGTRFVRVFARLSDGVMLPEAQGAVDLLAAQLAHDHPETDADWKFSARSLRSDILANDRAGLLVLSAAVALLLLVACANLAGLLLSRHASRQGEYAVRRALGMPGRRFLQQLAAESLLLFAFGGTAGVLLAYGLLHALTGALPPELLSFSRPQLDLPTLGFVLAVLLLAGLACSVIPAWQSGLTAPSQSGNVIGGTLRFGRLFAVAQIALSLVLLSLASALLSQLYRILQTPLGYQPSHLLTFSVHLPFGSDPGKIHALYNDLGQRLVALPGVRAVGAISALPTQSFSVLRAADIVGRTPTPHRDSTRAEGRTITPGYLPAMGVPLLAGRSLTEHDSAAGAPPVVLINRSFRDRYFPGENPVGRRLVIPQGLVEIVGVMGDVHLSASPNTGIIPEIDEPEQGFWPDMHFVLRTPLPAAALEPVVRRQLASLNPGVAFGSIEPLSGQLDRTLAQPRLNSALLTGLAGLALLLVAVGVYGTAAFAVAQRTRELSLRLALGATRGHVFGLVLRQCGAMLLAGLPIGAAAAFISRPLLAFATQAAVHDGPLFILPPAVLLILAVMLAGIPPARRAASLDPIAVLRSE